MKKFLQRLIDDERLKPRAERERHPIPDDPPADTIDALVREVHMLKCLTGQLWDQVWWISIPLWQRVVYRLLGFKSPIERFYLPPER